MTDVIKAIPTLYRGVKFRSKLEARWAVFFDEMGLSWRYESQAFNLPAVGGYLPGGVREACTLPGEKPHSPVYHPHAQTRGGITIIGIHAPARAGVAVHAARKAKFESAGATL